MSNLFVDTSGWANIFVSSEGYHTEAQQYFLNAWQAQRPLVTTSYIVAELVALLQSPLRIPRDTIFQVVDSVRQSEHIQIIHITPDIDAAAWSLCKNRPDKTWSLVDCTSFVIMQQLGLQETLTTDQHFEQAGFIRLLKP
jgi:predicted nucleic acid-binding protein